MAVTDRGLKNWLTGPKAAAFTCMSLLSFSCLAGCQAQALSNDSLVRDDRPNILWLLVEDTSPWMTPWGDLTVETPTLDTMSREGVTFLNAYAPNPICSPTRSALMTGNYPTTNGMHNHRASRDPEGRDAVYLPENELTLPEIFQENGYVTFNVGKDDYNFVYDRRELYSEGPDGIMGHLGELDGPDFDWEELAKGGPFFGQIQLDGGKVREPVSDPVDPQTVRVPPYYADTPEVRRLMALHYDTITVLDEQVSEILHDLEETGEADNTAVFMISDGGMQLLRHKQFNYDGGLHVPVFVRFPNGTEAIRANGVNRKDIVSLIDMAAASLGLAGIDIPTHFEAEDVFAPEYRVKHHVFASRDLADYTFDRIRTIRSDRYSYTRNYYTDRPLLQAQYRDHWKMMKEMKALYEAGALTAAQEALLTSDRPAEELYDTAADPHQINNLAGDPRYSKIRQDMSNALDEWIEETGDTGGVPMTDEEILAVLAAWQDACVDPACLRVVEEYGMPEPTAVTRSFVPSQAEVAK